MAIWRILRTFGIIYGHLEYLLVIWYIFPLLVSIAEKNLATLTETSKQINELNLFSNECRLT
jgi:hypothetical protein